MIFTTHSKLTPHIHQLKSDQKTIGFVPTMGALHAGHISLMQQAYKDCDLLVVSIFVNPTQFDNATDLDTYPRTIDQDVALIHSHFDPDRCVIYTPDTHDIYGDNPVSKSYHYGGIEHEMEGANRPGHFDGVGTILEFLFSVTQPDKAYFGEKDFQQLQIVKQLVQQLQLDIEIIGCPILREENGLAMSSRNERLSKSSRAHASAIYRYLQKAKGFYKKNSIPATIDLITKLFEKDEHLRLEYVVIASEQSLKPVSRKYKNHSYRAFIVAHIDGVRLIDNIALT